MDPQKIVIAPVPLAALTPLIVLIGAAFVVLLADAFLARSRRHLAGLSVLALAVAFGLVCHFLGTTPAAPFAGMFANDDYAWFFDLMFCLAGMATIGLTVGRDPALARGEYWALLLLATAGMMMLAHAASLVTLFLGLEVLSIVLYALTGFHHERPRSAEAALKYFFLGAFASSFLIYGMALIYGTTGTFEIAKMAPAIAARAAAGAAPSVLVLVGAALMLVGFAFKISAVPFHMWTPDVYQGAPTPVAAFMSVGTKAAAFAALLRVFVQGLAPIAGDWRMPVAVIAVLTMMVGNLTALTQSNLKRLLAFSSVAHAGYALIGLVAWEKGGSQAVLFYLFAYTFMNLGAFGLVAALERSGEETYIHDLAGLARRRPFAAAAMALFLLSLAGVPPTAGFAGKLGLFLAAVDAGWTWLAVLAVVYSAIAAYFYLRIIVYMYMKPVPEGTVELPRIGLAASVVLASASLGVVLLGLLPSPVLLFLDHAVRSL